MAEYIFTEQNFEEEVLKSDIPVLVDFYATWCGPCKMLAPTIEEIAQENEGKIKVGKIDVDKEQNLAIKFGVNVIPTVMAFKGGKLLDKSVGFVSKEDLLKLFE